MVKERWSSVAAAVVGVIVVFAAAPASAQPSSRAERDPVLGQLIEDALARSPEIRAAEADVSAARARAALAGARPDPMVSMTFTNDGWAPSLGSMPMTTLGFMVSQEFPYAGKRQLRSHAAAREARALEPRVARLRLGIAAQLTRAYDGLLLARALQSLIAEQRALWTQIESVARARYAAGQGTQQDVLRVQVEVTRIEQRAIEQATEIELRTAEINRLLARPLGTPVVTSARLDLVPLAESDDAIAERVKVVSPELEAARRTVDAGQAARAQSAREFKPDFTLQGGYMNRGGLAPMWLAGIGMSIPSSSERRQHAARLADASVTGSEQEIDEIGLQLHLRTQQRVLRARSIEKLIALYDGGILPQDSLTVESAIAGYQTDRVAFVAVLEAMNTLFSDRLSRAGLVADHARLRADLDEASLDPVDMGSPAPSAGATRTMAGGGAVNSGMAGR
jgi:outer membrane protein TolC